MLSNNIPSPLQYSLHKMHNEGFTFTQVSKPTHLHTRTYTHVHMNAHIYQRVSTHNVLCVHNYTNPNTKVDAHVCMTHNLQENLLAITIWMAARIIDAKV